MTKTTSMLNQMTKTTSMLNLTNTNLMTKMKMMMTNSNQIYNKPIIID